MFVHQRFDAVGRKGIRPVKKTEWWGAGVVISVCSEVQTCIWPSWCHWHSLSLASVKSRLVLPFWFRLTWVVPDKGPLNVCSCRASDYCASVWAWIRLSDECEGLHVCVPLYVESVGVPERVQCGGRAPRTGVWLVSIHLGDQQPQQTPAVSGPPQQLHQDGRLLRRLILQVQQITSSFAETKVLDFHLRPKLSG